MVAVLQRASHASVTIDGVCRGKIGTGILVLLGVAGGDDKTDAELLAEKIIKMRIFCDDDGKMNHSVQNIGGNILVIPNFTLLANYKKGNRPDYMHSADKDTASMLFDYFCDYVGEKFGKVERGLFGADMKVELLNDGPVTIVIDSKVLRN